MEFELKGVLNTWNSKRVGIFGNSNKSRNKVWIIEIGREFENLNYIIQMEFKT